MSNSETIAHGPYTNYELHARGGLGEVLKATDCELHRVVAVKRLQDKCAEDAENQRRFRVEAEITARLGEQKLRGRADVPQRHYRDVAERLARVRARR